MVIMSMHQESPRLAGDVHEEQHESRLVPGPRIAPAPLTQRRWAPVVLGVTGLVTLAVIWEAGVRAEVLPPADIPRPLEVASALGGLLGENDFWTALGQTFIGAGTGLAIATAVALVAGVAMGASEVLRRAFRPTVEFLRPVPGLTLIPLAILLWGPSTGSTIFLVAFGCTWPLLVQTMAGVSSADQVGLMAARSYGLGVFARIRWVIIPSALPYVMTGLRICASIALIVAIGGELIVGTPGVGSMIRQAQQALKLDDMYALVLASGVLGIATTLGFERAERFVLRWRSYGEEGSQ